MRFWCHDVLADRRQAALMAVKERKLKVMVATSFPPHLPFPLSSLPPPSLPIPFLPYLFPPLSSSSPLLSLLFSLSFLCYSAGRMLLTLRAKASHTRHSALE